MTRIRKAVFPVAGLGTRFLPATKASPKEMLPIVDKPMVQYAAEEALSAGLTHLVFITGRNKRAIEDHFDKAYELEVRLEYIRQVETLGLGHAVLCAKPVVGDEPFAVILADDVMEAQPSVMKQMVDLYARYGHSIIAVENVPREQTGSYGIVEIEPLGEGVHRITNIVEKPSPDKAPSTLAVVGRYLLKPRIFFHLERLGTGAGGEYQLTDAIAALLKEEPVLAYEFRGQRYDCGNKFGYVQATVEYALRHPEIKDRVRDYLKHLKL
jgi:UTP--glucose-1-phosphate uridylyltransferase